MNRYRLLKPPIREPSFGEPRVNANRIVAFRTSAVRHNLRGAAAPFVEEPDCCGRRDWRPLCRSALHRDHR